MLETSDREPVDISALRDEFIYSLHKYKDLNRIQFLKHGPGFLVSYPDSSGSQILSESELQKFREELLKTKNSAYEQEAHQLPSDEKPTGSVIGRLIAKVSKGNRDSAMLSQRSYAEDITTIIAKIDKAVVPVNNANPVGSNYR